MRHIILLMAFMLLIIGLHERKDEISSPIIAGAIVILSIWILSEDFHNKFKKQNNDKNPH